MKNLKQTKLSSKGQVVIPKSLRQKMKWTTGQSLSLVETSKGILLKPNFGIPKTKLEDVAGCLAYSGKSKSIQQIKQAAKRAVQRSFR